MRTTRYRAAAAARTETYPQLPNTYAHPPRAPHTRTPGDAQSSHITLLNPFPREPAAPPQKPRVSSPRGQTGPSRRRSLRPDTPRHTARYTYRPA
ncbi:unnamed protein product [Boreogadus saida]